MGTAISQNALRKLGGLLRGSRLGVSALRALLRFSMIGTGAFGPGKGCISPSGLRPINVETVSNGHWSKREVTG